MVKEDMSSPLGHAYAGIAAAWTADLIPGARRCRLAVPGASSFQRVGGAVTLACAALAALPDLDLAFRVHRSASHSIAAVAAVTILCAVVTGWVTRRTAAPTGPCSVSRIALMCGAAYATHLLVDWLSVDLTPPYGIQLFWPLSRAFYISGLDLFPRTERRELAWWAIRINVIAASRETAIFAPILGLLWWVRVKSLARFAAELSSRNHSAQ